MSTRNFIDFYYYIRSIPKRLKRLFGYLPIIWNNEDWEDTYVFELLQYKLKRMRLMFIKNNFNSDEWNEENIPLIKECEDILNELANSTKMYDNPYREEKLDRLFYILKNNLQNWWD